ncbi:4377_t:CDS:1 [Diversispora eburnea]|uniref:4377_t:CDS:1 n=1 Tax=Diversispora eburnea TaxID=1213867 RepID=A0A9N8V6A9_9GLOM|nr:4377_t:CDS:1 [Diversispora eburnea]
MSEISEISEEKETKETKETINIVVSCDGTLNGPTVETNLYKLHILLLYDNYCNHCKDDEPLKFSKFKWLKDLQNRNQKYRKTREIASGAFRYEDQYYEKGVGENFNLIDTALGYSMIDRIKRAYRHIVRRYNDNKNEGKHKEIWLFGFSRGAFTVRCVAGMIQNCGILKYDSKKLINRAYDLYRSGDPDEEESISFRKSFSHPGPPVIKFLGLWDTVGAQGLPSLTIGQGFEYLKLHDNNVSKLVKNAYQVLAIHEKSVFFEPIPINNECEKCEECRKDEECEECKKNEECKNNEKCERIKCEECEKNKECRNSKKCTCTKLEEIWFPGDHLEVGGGTFSVDKYISNESLLWMIRKILYTGGLFSEKRLGEKEFGEKRINKIPKSRFRSLLQYGHYLIPFFYLKRASTTVPYLGRNRNIPLYRDDNGMLTFDLLYEKGYWDLKGYWKNKRFKNIDKIRKHKYKPNSLVEFYDTMEDILIEEFLATNGNDGEIDKKDGNEEIEKILNSIKDNPFDAKTISKFNKGRLIHRYKAHVVKDSCLICNLRDSMTNNGIFDRLEMRVRQLTNKKK